MREDGEEMFVVVIVGDIFDLCGRFWFEFILQSLFFIIFFGCIIYYLNKYVDQWFIFFFF